VHPLTRRFLVTAAGFLIAGISLGLGLLVNRELFNNWPSPFLVSAHTHLLLAGAVLEMIIGTALWLFPRAPGTALTPLPRSATVSWWALTLGTAIRALAEAGRTWSDIPHLRWCVVAGGVLQVAGLACGIIALRGRVRASTRIR